MREETEFEQAVTDQTAPLREAVVARCLGTCAARVGYPLDTLLTAFATRHVVGMVAAFYYLLETSDVPEPELDESHRSTHVAFVWASLMTTLLFHALKATANLDDRTLLKVQRGLEAASDRIAMLAYEEGAEILRRPTPAALPRLLSAIGRAYATGVALAHGASRAQEAVEDDELRSARAALDSLPARDRKLLEARYTRGASVKELALDRGWTQPDTARRIGAALARLRSRPGEVSR